MLNVYRASAGSGKTYQLTLEYVKLLLSPSEGEEGLSPEDRQCRFRRILAVTFTNKATEEMKHRIINELDLLARDPGSSSYLDKLLGQGGITSRLDELQRQASDVLYSLLHDFSSFNISTIDGFFQQVTRSFMHEIGYVGGYNIELDSNLVLTEAVDKLLFDLEKGENKALLKWLVDYACQLVEEESYKKFRKKIDELANEVLKEKFRSQNESFEEVLQDKDLLTKFIRSLTQAKRSFEQDVRMHAKTALALLADNGLSPQDFKGGNSSGAMVLYQWSNGIYTKLPTPRFRQIVESDYTQWYTKGKLSPETIAAMDKIEIALQSIFQKLLDLYENAYSNYLSACHTKRYLYVLGIVHDIVVHIREYQNEHGTLLLSDTNDLLGKIISYDDTPFVYEKFGTQIDHYFIDEFQDTSLMQWRNFYPLIKESIDRGMTNLLVGDVKQSIYRWRNSDWELLNERIPEFFTKEEWREEMLDTNWRSAREVIRFNNTFFEQVATLLQKRFNSGLPSSLAEDDSLCHQIEWAYRNAVQMVGKEQSADGYVEIDFLEAEILKDGEEFSAKERVLNRTVEILRDLQDRGFALRDIAILVRSKNEGNMVVQHLLETQAKETRARYRYDVISDEALYIGNSPTVQLIIAVLDYLNAPQDELGRFFARYWTETLYRGVSPDRAIPALCKLLHTDSPDELLTRMEQLRGQSLYELCEELINLFPVDKSGEENVFVQAFLDLVLQYMDKYSSDLDSFLSWWHEKGATHSLSTPESQDAVRVMTIHKSKGLEFKVVLIPFCNWTIDHQPTYTNILWAETTKPFDTLPVVPVAYRKKLAETSYARAYFTEQVHCYIDNLNLAYVAFTRACEELYVFVPMENKKKFDIGSLLKDCLTEEEVMADKEKKPYTDLKTGYNPSTDVYTLGIRRKNKRLDRRKIPDSPAPYGSVLPGGRLRLRLMGQDFFGDENRRHYGTVCHDILSRIVTAEDVVPALREHIQAGEISSDEAREIGETLCRQLDEPQKKSWFQADNRVLNEREILQPDRGAYRPDRMVFNRKGHVTVIDYKFGRERASYTKQVAGYMHLLEEMGYIPEGYIWYVSTGKVVPVTR